MRDTNEMEIQFDSKSCNEGFARVAVQNDICRIRRIGYKKSGPVFAKNLIMMRQVRAEEEKR